MKGTLAKLGTRIAVAAFGAYIALQGLENLRSGNLSYWNVSRRFVLYPEVQITSGVIGVLLAVLPLGRIIDFITRPYLSDRVDRLRPYWSRRTHKQRHNP